MGLGQGESFYQNEPLTARLKNLIHDYPEGVGIVKELIQNADDAGASRVEIIFDWRTHSFEKLPDPKMAQLMGAAMLVYNNSTFSDNDFKSIQSLGVSGKQTDLQKTGRFGVGFNSVYHVTDYPSFISRDRIAFFDPHASAIPTATRSEPGRIWQIAEGRWWDFPDFMRVYELGGLQTDAKFFDGTLFRLPLRTQSQADRSEIRNQPFTQENVKELLSELVQVGEDLLLFLKSVVEIRVREIELDGTNRELISIVTTNQDEVITQRRMLRSPLQGDLETFIAQAKSLPAVSYRHEIETTTETELTQSSWRVSSLMRVDEQGELINVLKQLAQQNQKAIPWAGAAACIARSSTASVEQPFWGRAYCFLPLPQMTGLPVHINGFFDLDSSRHELTSDNLTGRDRIRVTWNQLLVHHVLTYAYANLITELVADVGEADPERFYEFLPTAVTSGVLAELPSRVFNLLNSREIIRSTVSRPALVQRDGKREIIDSHWIKPSEIKVLPQIWKDLVEPLRLEEINLPEPAIPTQVQDAFANAGCALQPFTPLDLRLLLASNCVPSKRSSLKRREWVIRLLSYCLSDGHGDVRGLPLAILADGSLGVFGKQSHEYLYDVTPTQREIFKNYPQWLLDADLVQQVPTLRQCQGVKVMTAIEVAERLCQIIDPDEDGVVAWQPTAQNLPNADWLAKVYDYLASLEDLPINKLQQVLLVPSNDKQLHYPGCLSTPLWCGAEVSKPTLTMLKYFKVPLVEVTDELHQAITKFLRRHPETLIWNLTVPDLIDTLGELVEALPAYHEKHYKNLISFLNDRHWLEGEGEDDDDRKDTLRQLPIYLTTDNQLTALEDVYLPGSETPPVAGSVKLLRTGPTAKSQEWKSLFDFLGVPVLDCATLIQTYLLPGYSSLSGQEQLEALVWIRDNLSAAQTHLEVEGRNSVELKRQIRAANLIRCTDGELRPANRIYTPTSYKVVHQILGDRAYMPDMAFYSEGAQHWQDFFAILGMLTTPSADDLLAHVEGLMQKADQTGVELVTDFLMAVLRHIETNWEKLKTAKVTHENRSLAEALKTRAWLPPERREKNLKRYPGYSIPPNKLCRANQICFIQSANLVASQKPLLRVQNELEKEIREALGFVDIDRSDVVNHFKVLIDLWERDRTAVDRDDLNRSLNSIYRYFGREFLGNRAVPHTRLWLKNQLQGLNSLWDGEQFWKPEHTFQESVSFFGRRRRRINDGNVRSVYEMLGQKQSPDLIDYLAFLDEVAQESNGQSLADEDADCVIRVLNRLWRDLAQSDAQTPKDLLLLTEEGLLLPANQVLLPDAPWRLEGVRKTGKAQLLHPRLYQQCLELAKQADCRSLLKDTVEQARTFRTIKETRAIERCRQWQRTLRATELQTGLVRLIVDEHDVEPSSITKLDWLRTIRVLPAEEIVTDLYLGKHLIGEDVPGDYYFDDKQLTFYVRFDREDESVMQSYLAESLNYQLEEFKLGEHLRHLERMLETEPKNIERFLDKQRVRPLQKRSAHADIEENSLEEDSIFADDTNQETLVEQAGVSDLDSEETPEQAVATRPKPSVVASSTPSANQAAQRPTKPAAVGTSSVQSPAVPQGQSARPTPVQLQPAPKNLGILGVGQSEAAAKLEQQNGERSMNGQEFGGNGRSSTSTSSRGELTSVGKNRSGQSADHRVGQSRSSFPSSAPSPRHQRLRSYVVTQAAETLELDDEDKLSGTERAQIEQAGVARVVAYEQSQGRRPQDMNEIDPNHPGYDISSENESGELRYIEVKSKRGVWDGQGVKLTQRQFDEALDKQEQFWLYVVEQAENDRHYKIFRIQNPACRVDEFYYDVGWQEVAEIDE